MVFAHTHTQKDQILYALMARKKLIIDTDPGIGKCRWKHASAVVVTGSTDAALMISIVRS